MTIIQKLVIFLNYLGVGLFAPVLSLFLLGRGCDMRELSVVIGIYSAVVIAAEVPSGMFADIQGRKRAYYVSAASTFASFVIMYFADSLTALIPGIVLFGLGVAFQSGSLDSLIIEDCIRRRGDGAMAQVTGTLLVYQCGGIAAGALLCAVLPDKGSYLPLIVLRLSVLLLCAALCAGFLREGKPGGGERPDFLKQARSVFAALKGRPFIPIVLLCIFGGSVSLFALETYWQPQLAGLASRGQSYMLGILCAVGYGGNLLGSLLASRIKLTSAKGRWRCYLLCTACLGGGLCGLALQGEPLGFMLCYVAVMALLGAANVPEQTLLNSEAPNELRASLLSTASLASKLSGILSSVVCAALVVPMGIPGVWLLLGSVTILVAAIAAALLAALKHRRTPGEYDTP